MYCFFNKFFFKVEIFGNLPIFCHAHLVAIQDFVDREILFDRCGKCPMLCLFFDFKWTISAVKSTAHVMPCFMRQHSAFLCGGLAFAAINDKEIVKERDCEIVFEFNMQNGIDFENLVTAIVNGHDDPNNPWSWAAGQIAAIVNGGQLQFKARRKIQVRGMDVVLYGRLDALKAGTIYDIKFSKGYERGKFYSSTQHPTYMLLIPEAQTFSYLVSNGMDVWTECYRRDETPDICPIISDFFDWLDAFGLMNVFKEHWKAL